MDLAQDVMKLETPNWKPEWACVGVGYPFHLPPSIPMAELTPEEIKLLQQIEALLCHLKEDMYATLAVRQGRQVEGPPFPRHLVKPSNLHGTVGVFAIRDIAEGTVVDHSIDGVDDKRNFVAISRKMFEERGIGLEQVPPFILEELACRYSYNDTIVLPTYGLNIFRLASYIKVSETDHNCEFADVPSRGTTFFGDVVVTRHIAKGEELLFAPGAFPEIKTLQVDSVPLSLTDHLKNNIFCVLGASRYGVGSYAVKDIPKGTLIDVNLGNIDDGKLNSISLTWEEIHERGIHPDVEERLKTLYQTDDDGYITLPAYGCNLHRLCQFINHNEKDNCDFLFIEGNTFASMRAKRSIKCGEELSINYHKYLSEEQKLLPMFAFLKEQPPKQSKRRRRKKKYF